MSDIVWRSSLIRLNNHLASLIVEVRQCTNCSPKVAIDFTSGSEFGTLEFNTETLTATRDAMDEALLQMKKINKVLSIAGIRACSQEKFELLNEVDKMRKEAEEKLPISMHGELKETCELVKKNIAQGVVTEESPITYLEEYIATYLIGG